MDLKDFYKSVGGDYDLIMSRMGNKEERVVKFLNKFSADPSFENLKQALSENNAEDAFRAAHSIKGVALNLELQNLQAASDQLTETLREGNVPDNAQELLEQVGKAYQEAVDGISQL